MNDLLAAAAAELYESDPDEFTARRAELAAEARDQGQPDKAKQITALRKPTRSAWVLNRLVREYPDVPERLADLAADLRAGGDGQRIRELTREKSRLIDELTRQALDAAGLGGGAPAALREDVTGTLSAALADPDVAADLAAGTLVRAAHWAGFGEITLAPPDPAEAGSAEAGSAEAETAAGADLGARAGAGAGARAERAERRRAASPPPPAKPLMSQRTVDELTRESESAAEAERHLEQIVRALETELEQAREQLAQARRDAYRAEQRRKKAADELGRTRE